MKFSIEDRKSFTDNFLKLANKAADIWKSLLKSPVYDNGDKSENGILATALAMQLPSNTTDELLDKFKEALVKKLSEKWDEGGMHFWMDVDYGPCGILDEAAEEAGLNVQFPWKTSVSIHLESKAVSVSAGYGAEDIIHYDLENGKWLVTTLHGSEVEKIKDHVVNGTPLEFKVE